MDINKTIQLYIKINDGSSIYDLSINEGNINDKMELLKLSIELGNTTGLIQYGRLLIDYNTDILP
jgi:hypothetical protein